MNAAGDAVAALVADGRGIVYAKRERAMLDNSNASDVRAADARDLPWGPPSTAIGQLESATD